jgi:hypothetical protein
LLGLSSLMVFESRRFVWLESREVVLNQN